MHGFPTKIATGFLLTLLSLMSCAQDISANAPGLCVYNTMKTIPGVTSLEAYGKDADFIRYGYRDAKGKETSSTLSIVTSGTPPRTRFEGAFRIVPDDPVAKAGGPIEDKCNVYGRLMDQTLVTDGSPTMTWKRAN